MTEPFDPVIGTLRHEIRELRRTQHRHTSALATMNGRIRKLEAAMEAVSTDFKAFVNDLHYDEPVTKEGEDG